MSHPLKEGGLHKSDVFHPLGAKKIALPFDGLPAPEMFEVLRQYEVSRPLARGTFGFVALAIDTLYQAPDEPLEDGPNAPRSAVAIKKVRNIFCDPRMWLSAVRELSMLCFFNHPNVMRASDVMIPLGDHYNLTAAGIESRMNNFDEVYIVMDFMDTTLKRLFAEDQPRRVNTNPCLGLPGDVSHRVSGDHTWNDLRPMGAEVRAYLLFQILQGIDYLHRCGVVHRDLKPENILVNFEWGAKVCDFGQGRGGLAAEDEITGHIETSEVGQCTQYYAAPEHLRFAFNLNQSNAGLINRELMHADDVWAVGCIAAEMLIGKPIFDATSAGGQAQLDCILNILGQPSPDDLAAMQQLSPYNLPEYFEKSPAHCVTENRLKSVLRAAAKARLYDVTVDAEQYPPIEVSEHEVDLIASMLTWNPGSRVHIQEALKSPLFDTLRDGLVQESEFPARHFTPVDKQSLADATQARKIIWDLFNHFHPEVVELVRSLGG